METTAYKEILLQQSIALKDDIDSLTVKIKEKEDEQKAWKKYRSQAIRELKSIEKKLKKYE